MTIIDRSRTGRVVDCHAPRPDLLDVNRFMQCFPGSVGIMAIRHCSPVPQKGPFLAREGGGGGGEGKGELDPRLGTMAINYSISSIL